VEAGRLGKILQDLVNLYVTNFNALYVTKLNAYLNGRGRLQLQAEERYKLSNN
jgi:hypothetical protein